MGAIAAWIGSAITGFVSLITTLLGQKLAFSAVYIAVYSAIVVAFTLAINGLLTSLMVSAPAQGFIQAGFSLVPSFASTCIGAIATSHALRWAYLYKHKLLNIKVKS